MLPSEKHKKQIQMITIRGKNLTVDKGLISLYKELLRMSKKMIGKWIEKYAKDTNVLFTEREIQIVYKPN